MLMVGTNDPQGVFEPKWFCMMEQKLYEFNYNEIPFDFFTVFYSMERHDKQSMQIKAQTYI